MNIITHIVINNACLFRLTIVRMFCFILTWTGVNLVYRHNEFAMHFPNRNQLNSINFIKPILKLDFVCGIHLVLSLILFFRFIEEIVDFSFFLFGKTTNSNEEKTLTYV